MTEPATFADWLQPARLVRVLDRDMSHKDRHRAADAIRKYSGSRSRLERRAQSARVRILGGIACAKDRAIAALDDALSETGATLEQLVWLEDGTPAIRLD